MTARLQILGVPVDAVTLQEAVQRMQEMIGSGAQHHVLTPNPEMLVAARSNPAFLSVLQFSSLNVPDGYGLILASRFLGSPLPERVSGVDLLTEFCRKIDVPVFFLGAAPGVAERAAAVLKKNNPMLITAGTHAGSPRVEEEDEIVCRINASGARVLFVAYGAPAQDLWIAKNLQRMRSVRLAMGVGGSFDFLAEVRKRAPYFLRACGFEWLWRLLKEPKRIGRIFKAVVIFPFLVLTVGSTPPRVRQD